ncbi:MAG: tRNA-dihydrouridine synthase family protein [Cellulosilyticum sp.]|nr:tRNA-dihydrouridine synthase family protein [Cellulosilyticum sp.]
MKLYLAPLEGLTGYIYRNNQAKYFSPLDKYFTPFIAANQNGKLSSRELNDILPEHNQALNVVPQILTNKSADFLLTTERLQSYGYEEVNLNLGCPSGTVVSKNKGSGFLSQKEDLNRFLEEVFSRTTAKVSIKTRIGKDSPEEFAALMDIYNQYPMEELIIHPRIQKDYYRNTPNMEVFKEALATSKNSICYNGDIFTLEQYKTFVKECPTVEKVMLGRGIIANPGLAREILCNQSLDKATFKAYHDQLYKDYREVLSGAKNVLFKLKEQWFYMSHMFEDVDKYAKQIRKSQKLHDYEAAVNQLFEEKALLEGAGLFTLPSKT